MTVKQFINFSKYFFELANTLVYQLRLVVGFVLPNFRQQKIKQRKQSIRAAFIIGSQAERQTSRENFLSFF